MASTAAYDPRGLGRRWLGALGLVFWAAPAGGPEVLAELAERQPPAAQTSFAQGLEALRELLSAAPLDRLAAIERLAAALHPDLAPALSAALLEADVEGRLRIEQALGASARAPELLLRLLADGQAAVSRSAERAFAARLKRFSAGLGLPLARGNELLEALSKRLADEPLRWFELSLGEDPRENCRRLGRADRGPLPLVLDPALADSIRRFPAPPVVLRGSFDQLAFEIARQAGLELVLAQGAGAQPEDANRSLFLCLALEGQPVGTSTEELMLGWLRALALGDPANSSAEAIALCLCGFDEALTLCGNLAFDAGHSGALWGLLAAAAEGRMDPRLFEPQRFSALIERALAELEGSEPAPFARELAAAVARFPRLGGGGADLVSAVLERSISNERQERYVLRLCGDLGGGTDAFEARLARAWSAAPGAAGPSLRRQALLSSASGARPGFTLGACGDPRGLLPLLLQAEDARNLGRAAEASLATLGPDDSPWFGLGVPADLAALPRELLARAEGLSLRALLAAGQRERVVTRLLGALEAAREPAEIGELALAFRDWSLDGRRLELEDLLSELETAAPLDLLPKLDSWALRLTLGDGARRLRAQPAILAAEPTDFEGLAALAGTPEGSLSRARLLVGLRAAIEPKASENSNVGALYEALAAALEGLRRSGADGEALRFQQAVLAAARRRSDQPLAMTLLARPWPPPPGLVAQRLQAGEALAQDP